MKNIKTPEQGKTTPLLSRLSVAVRAGIMGVGLAQGATHAANITVTSMLDDDGNGCTLREAIASANSAVSQNNGCEVGSASGTDTISFANSLVAPNNSITLDNRHLNIDGKDLEINASSVSGGITVDANKQSRVIVATASLLSINGLTITQGNENEENGGGILIRSGLIPSVVTLTDCLVSNNSTTLFGGGIAVLGSTLTLTNSTVSGNSATFGGGGIRTRASDLMLYGSSVNANTTGGEGSSGGGIFAYGNHASALAGSVRLVESTVSSNTSYGGGGITAVSRVHVSIEQSQISENTSSNTEYVHGGGIEAKNSVFTISNSRLSGNTVARNGGAFSAERYSIITINNSTLSGNSARLDGGALYNLSSTVTLNNSTVSNNLTVSLSSITVSRGILNLNHTTLSGNRDGPNSATLNIQPNGLQTGLGTLTNSIIANSKGPHCAGTVITDLATIIEDGTCGANRTGDPRLLALRDNGGPTLTHALSPNSSARNSSASSCLAADQRGEARNISDGVCDVGAFEFIEGQDEPDDSGFFVVPLNNGRAVIIEL